ncbi:MAG TPA: DNA methyltransferase [Verrucomicrobiae bacterium]
MNKLLFGDNLKWLRDTKIFPDASVDLIYLDPPFNSNADYNLLFREDSGETSQAQFHAFTDTWNWADAAQTYREFIETCDRPAAVDMLEALQSFLKTSPMMAYLAMMAPRLVELHRVLKSTGSLYLHCDPTASHYLRMLLDGIFGKQNFRNEIIWYYYNKMHDRRKKLFPKATDTIFFYVKDVTSDFTFHQLKEMRDEPVKQLLRKKVAGVMVNVKDEAGHVIYRMKEDRTLDNVWRIPCLQPAAAERLDYPTQKPQRLLERIIEASSNPGDLILDPFCGCGTTVHAAQKLKRRWIGIDVTYLAINLIKIRLQDAFGDDIQIEERGQPTDFKGAKALAELDKWQFQQWALSLIRARPLKDGDGKGADRGVDGFLAFYDYPVEAEKISAKKIAIPRRKILVQVKGGHVERGDVTKLLGDVNNQGFASGVFITLEPPTRQMRIEEADAGNFKVHIREDGIVTEKSFPKIQILTVEKLMLGTERLNAPPRINLFAKAEVENISGKQEGLNL